MLELVRDDVMCCFAVNIKRERINIEHIGDVAADGEAAEARIAQNAASLVCGIKEARRVAASNISPIANVKQE